MQPFFPEVIQTPFALLANPAKLGRKHLTAGRSQYVGQGFLAKQDRKRLTADLSRYADRGFLAQFASNNCDPDFKVAEKKAIL